jgi:hypothetical protein
MHHSKVRQCAITYPVFEASDLVGLASPFLIECNSHALGRAVIDSSRRRGPGSRSAFGKVSDEGTVHASEAFHTPN